VEGEIKVVKASATFVMPEWTQGEHTKRDEDEEWFLSHVFDPVGNGQLMTLISILHSTFICQKHVLLGNRDRFAHPHTYVNDDSCRILVNNKIGPSKMNVFWSVSNNV
jgi:hypothetical protein